MPQKQRSWTIQRHFLAKAEGWSRWDQAYQSLLAWTSPCLQQIDEQEGTDEKSHLCPDFDPAASAEPDHRTTTRALTDVLPD
jgi:hypothetical protein